MDITLPNGHVMVGVPEGTSKTAVMTKAVHAGLAKYEDFADKSDPMLNPTGSGFQNFAAGVGKAGYDVARAVGQPFGGVSQSDIEASRQRDAALMNTAGGMTGNILGSAAILAPTAFIPGANTLAGAALIGGGTGLALTPGTLSERAQSGAFGAAGGVAGTLAGRGIAGLASGSKALVEPFTSGGREQIAGRTLQRFAGNADDAARAATNAQVYVPGSLPTAAEATADPGIAQLQRALASTDPQTMTAIANRETANRVARAAALQGIAKTDSARQAAEGFRLGITKPLYEAAMQGGISVDQKGLGELADILSSTHADTAWQRAINLAGKNKIEVSDAVEITPRHLQFLKMGFDDLLDSAPTSGIGKNERRVISETRDALNSFLLKSVPEYRKADKVYAKLSGPIDRMKVGQALYEKLAPALNDFGTNRENANAFALAIRKDDKTVRTATQFGHRGLDKILTKREMATVNNIAKDLARSTNKDLGKAIGSNTAQNLASQNVLRRTLGPFGMPDSWMEGNVLPALMGPARALQFLYNAMPEQKIQGLLGNAMINPDEAARLLKLGLKSNQPGLLGHAADRIAPLAGQIAGQRLAQ